LEVAFSSPTVFVYKGLHGVLFTSDIASTDVVSQ